MRPHRAKQETLMCESEGLGGGEERERKHLILPPNVEVKGDVRFDP